MKFISYKTASEAGLAVEVNGIYRGLNEFQAHYPGSLDSLIQKGQLALSEAENIVRQFGSVIDLVSVSLLPPVLPGKIICIGLNYRDHAEETGQAIPDTPTVFSRWASSIVGAEQAIIRPKTSEHLDFEGELAVIIGKSGRHIEVDDAYNHVAGYSCFNDGSIRDYQLRTPQWTIGKNFDRSGALGPALVTPDSLPPGASGLAIQTRLNGEVVQSSSTAQLIFDVAKLISFLSDAFTLEPGDVIATGTPSGVGLARTPPLWMREGDVCEVEIEGIGTLRNSVVVER